MSRSRVIAKALAHGLLQTTDLWVAGQTLEAGQLRGRRSFQHSLVGVAEARRVSTATSRSTLQATSFVNPDGRLATVVMNPTDKAIAYNFYVGQASAVVTIPARAIQTLVN